MELEVKAHAFPAWMDILEVNDYDMHNLQGKKSYYLITYLNEPLMHYVHANFSIPDKLM